MHSVTWRAVAKGSRENFLAKDFKPLSEHTLQTSGGGGKSHQTRHGRRRVHGLHREKTIQSRDARTGTKA